MQLAYFCSQLIIMTDLSLWPPYYDDLLSSNYMCAINCEKKDWIENSYLAWKNWLELNNYCFTKTIEVQKHK